MIDCLGKTDEELIPLVLENEDYYLCLMKRYEGKLLSFIKRISDVADEDARDILQEVFIKTYTSLNDFDPQLKFSSWIYRIARNHAISTFRKSQARPKLANTDLDSDAVLAIASETDLEAETDAKIAADRIRKALAEIDGKYREVLVLKYLEEKDYQEISDILEKPMGTVSTLISRAKKNFKDLAEQKNLKF